MQWRVNLRKKLEKQIARAPVKDRRRLYAALLDLHEDPFAGDVVKIEGEVSTFRRRVGSWRIIFDVNKDSLIVDVLSVRRRTSNTYR